IGVAALLLPGYLRGTQDTAYQRLERRFGRGARRAASGVFLLTRALADCVRIFATAIPLAIITHWSMPAGILAIGLVTVIYTWVGGLRAVVWVDVIQLGVYLLGGVATLLVATQLADARRALIGSGVFIIAQFALFLAAAMSSHASAVNSLASASTHDFYAPLSGRQEPTHLLWVGRWLTLVWTAVLVGGAIAFRNQNTPVVQLALSIASITYGGL